MDNRIAMHIARLQKEKAHLLVELGHLYQQLNAEIEVDVEGGDPELVDRDMTVSLIRVQEYKLNEIDHALEDARLGLYGICERCGRPINPERLEAIPEATLCVECKLLMEKMPFHVKHPVTAREARFS